MRPTQDGEGAAFEGVVCTGDRDAGRKALEVSSVWPVSFDTLDHGLVMRAVRKYTDCRWVLLYVERWLKAPIQREDGTLMARPAGTPQGGVVSPLLANIFLHLAFDAWMERTCPQVPFERYADDILVHCRTREQADRVRQAVQERLARCKLEVHPSKTKIVYCQGFESTRELSGDEVRLSEFHVSPTAGARTDARVLRELQSGGEPGGGEADPPGNASIVASPTAHRQGPDGPGVHVQSRHPWLDSVLRLLPQVRAVSGLPTPQPHPGQVGHAEVQAVQGASPAGGVLAGADRTASADVVRSLAAPRGEADGWLIGAV